jgi:hypothetical protein
LNDSKMCFYRINGLIVKEFLSYVVVELIIVIGI